MGAPSPAAPVIGARVSHQPASTIPDIRPRMASIPPTGYGVNVVQGPRPSLDSENVGPVDIEGFDGGARKRRVAGTVVVLMVLIFVGVLTMTLLSHNYSRLQSSCPRGERNQLLADDPAARLAVDEPAVGVDELLCGAHEHLRLVERMRVEEHATCRKWYCARIVPEHPGVAPMTPSGLPAKRSVPAATRSPIDGVLEDAGDGVVVLGGDDEERVRGDARA